MHTISEYPQASQDNPFRTLKLLALFLIIVGGGLSAFLIALLIYQKIIFALQDWDYKIYRLKQMASLEYTLNRLLATEPVQLRTSTPLENIMAGPNVFEIARKETTTKTPTKTASQIKHPEKSSSSPNLFVNATNYYIVIPKIGVTTEILRSGSVKKRMIKGVAIYNDYGTPDHNELPIILSSHRFGYAWWTPSYRRTHSFHNLDKLQLGDKIYIKWKGTWYVYKVIRKYIAREIRSYSVDLILYTCVDYISPNRIIVEAVRI